MNLSQLPNVTVCGYLKPYPIKDGCRIDWIYHIIHPHVFCWLTISKWQQNCVKGIELTQFNLPKCHIEVLQISSLLSQNMSTKWLVCTNDWVNHLMNVSFCLVISPSFPGWQNPLLILSFTALYLKYTPIFPNYLSRTYLNSN